MAGNDENLRRGSKREVATEAEGHRVFNSLRSLSRADPTPPKLGTPNSWQTLYPMPEKWASNEKGTRKDFS